MSTTRLKNATVSFRRYSTDEIIRRQDGKSGIVNRLYQRSWKKKSSMICFPEFQMAYSPMSMSAKQLSEKAESVNDGNFIATLRKSSQGKQD